MTQAFLGEIQLFGFNYSPVNWASCNGTTLPLQQHTALFSLLGTQYGGNGTTTFQLPNLVMRAPCQQGSGPGLQPRIVGEAFGVAQVTLDQNQMPAHRHTLTAFAQTDAGKRSGVPVTGGGLSLPSSNAVKPFSNAVPDTALSPSMLGPSGGNLPHSNQQPYLAVNFCIALQGVFPQFN